MRRAAIPLLLAAALAGCAQGPEPRATPRAHVEVLRAVAGIDCRGFEGRVLIRWEEDEFPYPCDRVEPVNLEDLTQSSPVP